MAQANTFTTPKGIAQYPWLSKPDTKFSEEGDYKVNLILNAEEAAPIIVPPLPHIPPVPPHATQSHPHLQSRPRGGTVLLPRGRRYPRPHLP